MYKRGYYPKSVYYKYLGKCALEIDEYGCYLERQQMDKNFNATNTSPYNIYSKCYHPKNNTVNVMNTGCEDEEGVLKFFNTDNFKNFWNI